VTVTLLLLFLQGGRELQHQWSLALLREDSQVSQYYSKGGGRSLMNRYDSFRASNGSSNDADLDDIISPELREQVKELYGIS
jgi:hypothetical protein